jgi:GNAT superfamily N-acetyltransferase
MSQPLQIRNVTLHDVPIVHSLIIELAIYEKMEQEVIATPEQLAFALFEEKSAYCVIGYEDEVAIGFALYFFNYSTFVGRKGLYLEDLYVQEKHRGKGYGKALFVHLKEEAKKQNCGRMEWSVLDWNKPAIDFYKNQGAKAMDEWTVYRMDIKKDIHFFREIVG